MRSDAASGTLGHAGWLFISDLFEAAASATLALLLGSWVALQIGSLRLARRVTRRRLAIAVLAPLPLVFAAWQIPAGFLLYVLVSAALGLAQRLALRAQTPAAA